MHKTLILFYEQYVFVTSFKINRKNNHKNNKPFIVFWIICEIFCFNYEKTSSTAVLFNNNPTWFFTCHYFPRVRTIMHFSSEAKTFFSNENHPFDYAELLSEVLQDRIWQKSFYFLHSVSKISTRKCW